MPRQPKPVASEVAVRLRKAQESVDETEEAWRLALEHRDRIVLEAVDVHGVSQVAIAKELGVAKGRIHGILSNSQRDDQ
jgi:DNA-directed RNA polymerase specialized sigma24 family protein